MAILELLVTAYGLPEHHKVKAALDTGHIVTLYIVSGSVSTHHAEKGGCGRFSAENYAHPEVIAAMRAAYSNQVLSHTGE